MPSFFLEIGPSRTDERVRDHVDGFLKKDEDSPFLLLSLDIVNDVPVETMHCLYQGVCRRFVMFLVGDYKGVPRYFTRATEERMTRHLIRVSECQPKGAFSRKPRPLVEYKDWKATEFRMFFCYTGEE